MTPQQLKNSILQQAIEGKLVEQRPEEGNGRDLLKALQKEKAQLVQAKKIRKEKPLPEIVEEEIPFEIPENWCWCRLKDLVYSRGQTKPMDTFCYIDIGSIDNKFHRLNRKDNIIESGSAPSRARRIVGKGDILYSTVRPYLHNICIVDREFSFQPIASTGFAVLTCHTGFYNKFLFYYLLCPEFDSYANSTENAKGVAYPAINDAKLYKALIPLPPLGEQKRIVARLAEILPQVEIYAQAYQELQELNSKFSGQLKNSLLQQAIEGKLVEQRPEEGNGRDLLKAIQKKKAQLVQDKKIKKEKPLPEIKEEEIPFEIPENWCWCRLGDIMSKIGAGSTPSGGKAIYQQAGIKFLRSQNIYNDGIKMSGIAYISEEINEKKQVSIVKPKDILLNITGGSIGRCALVPDDFDIANINQHILIIRNINQHCRKYIHAMLVSPYIQQMIISVQVGVSREGLSAEKTKNFLVPLPPLAEQKRIVAKLEQLLQLCQQLA